jgi:RNAse (barnase) inhibitor barstar
MMAWQVGIVMDLDHRVGALPGWLPVWAWATPSNIVDAEELREMYGNVWHPEAALTLITTPQGEDPVAALIAQIPTIEEHHPRMSAIRVFAPQISPQMVEGMQLHGYRLTNSKQGEWVVFSKPIEELPYVEVIELDAVSWRSQEDFYHAFFKAVGAPKWHGCNFDALRDSIGTGSINELEVPYRIAVRNLQSATPDVQQILLNFAELIRDLNADGCPVDLKFSDSDAE